ncbi:hypothetical protein ABBQ38_013777 [Trebouxia sp. C0009 RCD-2024]
MATVASGYTPAVPLSDSLLIPVHRAVSGVITMHDAILRGVDRRLPESLLHAVNRAKAGNELDIKESVVVFGHTTFQAVNAIHRYLTQTAKTWVTPSLAADAAEQARKASVFEEHYNWQKASHAEVVTFAKDTLTAVNDQATKNDAYFAELQVATPNSIGPVLDSQNPLWSQEAALPSTPEDCHSETLPFSLPTLYSASSAAPLLSQGTAMPSSHSSLATSVFINDAFDCVPDATEAATSPDIATTSKLLLGCVKSLTPIRSLTAFAQARKSLLSQGFEFTAALPLSFLQSPRNSTSSSSWNSVSCRNSSLTAESAPIASDRSFSDRSAADTSSEDDVVRMPSSFLRSPALPWAPLAKQRYTPASTPRKASSANLVSLVANSAFPLQAQKLKTASSFSQHSAKENFSFKASTQV